MTLSGRGTVRFTKYGKIHQLVIETPDDLEALLGLDEALWVATSAPIDAFRCDADFLAYVDTDRNGRVYTNEVKEAVRWLSGR